jgi:hypothetical protein
MKRNEWISRLVLQALVVFAGMVGIFSQTVSATPQQGDPQTATEARLDNQVFIQGSGVAAQGPVEIGFQSFSAVVPGKVVKDAPYSASATTEMTQQLSDGNQINHKTSSNIYRDSQGRTRREENFGGIGLLTVNGRQSHSVVFISDPVSGSDYILEPENKIARKMPSLPADGVTTTRFFGAAGVGAAVHISGSGGSNVQVAGVKGVQASGGPEIESVRVPEDSGVQVSSESLGQQTIEGVIADGKRMTTTIPAGAMGNQRPITTVTEEWFSRDLKVVVLSTTKDPRMGETTYRLTNIQRAEPSATLFTLPADYTVKDFDKPEFAPRPASE